MSHNVFYSKINTLNLLIIFSIFSDGVLEINYTVGNIERTYIIPPAVPVLPTLYIPN